MTCEEPTYPRVFISYSHDFSEHVDRVLQLCERLRKRGINAWIDQYEESPIEGWPRWMVNQVTEADFVLVVCTEQYRLRFEGKEQPGIGKGAKWEGAVITQELYDAEARNRKFIPIVFSSDDVAHIPIILKSARYYEFTSKAIEKELCRRLTKQPKITPVPVRVLCRIPPTHGKSDSFPIWNVPYPVNRFFVDREEILEKVRDTLRQQQIAALTGLGGIGKTQTALEFAYKYRHYYKAVLWARADCRDALISDFVLIATTLDLPSKDVEDQNTIVRAAKQWLENNDGWLLILDNISKPELVKEFLPPNPKGHGLLTSRVPILRMLGIPKQLEMKELRPNDASDFLLKRTDRDATDQTDKRAAMEIAKELGYLPLALEQAGAYIEAKGARFQDYLISYRKRNLELLKTSKPVAGGYPESVATTWAMNFQEVEQTSPAASDLLRISAFLDPQSIPFDLITKGAPDLGPTLSAALADSQEDPLLVNEVLEPLNHYSLICLSPDTKTYNIHPLVQSVLKRQMDTNTCRLYSERVVRALHRAFPDPRDFSNWPTCAWLLPHALVATEHIESWNFDSLDAASLLNAVGHYLYRRARYQTVEKLLKRAQAIREQQLGPDHPDVARVLYDLAWLYHREGRYDETETSCMRVLAICEQKLPPGHPDLARILENLGWLRYRLGRYNEAEDLFHQSLNIRKTAFGADHPEVADSLIGLTATYREQRDYFNAKEICSQALEIRKKALPEGHPDIAGALNHLARLYSAMQQYAEAEPYFKRVWEIWEASLGAEHTSLAQNFHNLGVLYMAQDRLAEAEQFLMRALTIRKNAYGLDHPDVAESLDRLAALYTAQGKHADAELVRLRALLAKGTPMGPTDPNTEETSQEYAGLQEDNPSPELT